MYKKSALALFFLLSLVVLGCFGGGGGDSSPSSSPYSGGSGGGSRGGGQAAPRAVRAGDGARLFRLPMADGTPVTVKSPAILFFYTSWCKYCKQVMPQFKQLTNRARAQGWRVYGIQVGEGPNMANDFINQYQPNFPVLLDQQSLVARQYGVKGYPTFVVIDENANIGYNSNQLPSGF